MKTVEVENLVMIKGIPFPEGDRFRQIIVTGPPGSGKTTLVEKLGGWPEEGYIDLAVNEWWRSQILTFRPREIHFGLPFRGHRGSHSVFDAEWLESRADIDFKRIVIPPSRRWPFSTDWRVKFVFDFQLPPADLIYRLRSERLRKGTHQVDENLSPALVERQFQIYWDLAWFFHRTGMRVHVRKSFEGTPYRFVDE